MNLKICLAIQVESALSRKDSVPWAGSQLDPGLSIELKLIWGSIYALRIKSLCRLLGGVGVQLALQGSATLLRVR